jgi:hypothetical protein
VVAFAGGGALETVVPPGGEAAPTGLFFEAPTADSLRDALRRFQVDEKRFDATAIRRHAERFSAARFRREIRAALDATLAEAA